MITGIDKNCIVLRKLKPEDEQDFVKYESDPDVVRLLKESFSLSLTLRDAHRWIYCVNRIAKGYFRAIELNNEVVGCVGVELQEDVFCKVRR